MPQSYNYQPQKFIFLRKYENFNEVGQKTPTDT